MVSAQALNGTGVGTGQPGRNDFNGPEHLDRLNAGRRVEIHQNSIGQTRGEKNPVERDAWRRQEHLLDQQGALRENRATDWSAFSGTDKRGTGRNLGQVAIDAPNSPQLEKPPTFTPDQLKNGMWVDQAAKFEEEQRGTRGKYGAGDGLTLPPIDVPGSNPSDGPGNPKNNRRSFRVG